jgi:Prophage CP4-57 regulatory protein (AlpA)
MIYRLQSQRRFPRSVKITEHAVESAEYEIQRWLLDPRIVATVHGRLLGVTLAAGKKIARAT